MDELEVLRRRRSISRLTDPAPSRWELHEILSYAALAPDHKELKPWRFIVIEGEARPALGELFATALQQRSPGATQGQLDKERSKPLRAPVIVAVAAKRLETNLPFSELVAATSAATQNILLAATAFGFGSIWRTGPPVTDALVKRALGLEAEDELVGFVYIGTMEGEPPPPRASSIDGFVTFWTGEGTGSNS